MDPTSANQYQNLHYTFQNLALSPPPPPPSEMPALPNLPQNGGNGPSNGQEAGPYYKEYAGNGQQPSHQGHQQQLHQEQHQQQGHQQQYYEQQQQGQAGQQRAGPDGPADMRSIGRNGWGSTAGASVNGGTAGAMSNASRGKGQRSGLPSVRPFYLFWVCLVAMVCRASLLGSRAERAADENISALLAPLTTG